MNGTTFAYKPGDQVRIMFVRSPYYGRTGTVIRDEVGGFYVKIDKYPNERYQPYVTMPSHYLATLV